MKPTQILLLYFLISCAHSLHAQQKSEYTDLDQNNIEARLYSDGLNFMNRDQQGSHFIVPAGSGKSTILASGLWIGGLADTVLHLSAIEYGPDFSPGPLDTGLGSINSARSQEWNKIWVITKSEIDEFRATGTVTSRIKAWPAHGNRAYYEPRYLAPFVDVDKDGIYAPENGDYPKINGDIAAWCVFNDALYKGSTLSGALPLGIEVQALAYEFYSPNNPTLQNTLFMEYKITNRGASPYNHVYAGVWTDFDLGYAFDDYVGCNPAENYYYVYNADDFDETTAGYGANPPLQAVVFLKDTMSSFIAYNNDFSPMGNPAGKGYYAYLAGRIKGDCIRQCDTCPCTKYMVPGDPRKPNEWSMASMKMAGPKDSRALGSIGPFTLKQGEVLELPFAYVYSETTYKNGTPDIGPLNDRVDKVHSVYKYLSTLSVENPSVTENDFRMYPNPCAGTLHLSWKGWDKEMVVSIMDMPGRTVYQNRVAPGMSHVVVSATLLKPGFYTVQLKNSSGSVTKKLEIIR